MLVIYIYISVCVCVERERYNEEGERCHQGPLEYRFLYQRPQQSELLSQLTYPRSVLTLPFGRAQRGCEVLDQLLEEDDQVVQVRNWAVQVVDTRLRVRLLRTGPKPFIQKTFRLISSTLESWI